MKKHLASSVRLLIAVLLVSVVTMSVLAQGKKEGDKKESQQNIQGTIQTMNKDASTISVRVGTATRVVAHSAKTKFLFGHSNDNKPGSLAPVKEGYYISCSGTFDSKGTLMAQECIYSESR